MAMIDKWLGIIDDTLWSWPLIILLLGVGILLTLRLGFVQVRHLPRALRYMVKNESDGKGEVSSFGALCTALSATIGTGNIVGVATAICAGGPGALFWMWLAAFFGMATKYAECLLAVKYRTLDSNGHALGGPFMYIEKGMGKNWKWLAKLFAIFGAGAGLLGIGTITQINGISSAVQGFFDPNMQSVVTMFGHTYSWATVIAAVVVTILVACVVIGGIKRIAKVSEIIVPFMAIFYFLACLLVLIINYKAIPGAFGQIFSGAFTGTAAVGGFAGAIIKEAIQKGVARGIFSNEAGLGSAPIATAAAKTNWTARQGLISMTGTFIDTIIICTMTGLAIISAGSWTVDGLEGAAVTSHAFSQGFFFAPQVGQFILMVCLAFFAFTTILGWDYYGERCLEYLSNGNKTAVKVYRYIFILAVLIGPFLTVKAVWTIADILNGLMAFPNLIALLALSGVVVAETKLFMNHLRDKGEIR